MLFTGGSNSSPHFQCLCKYHDSNRMLKSNFQYNWMQGPNVHQTLIKDKFRKDFNYKCVNTTDDNWKHNDDNEFSNGKKKEKKKKKKKVHV